MDDSYIRIASIRIANQLRQPVDVDLTKRILKLAKSQPSEEGFVRACREIGDFDLLFLSQLYNEKREDKPDRLHAVNKASAATSSSPGSVGATSNVDSVSLKKQTEGGGGSGLSAGAKAKLEEIRRKRAEKAKGKIGQTDTETVSVEPLKRKLEDNVDDQISNTQQRRPKFRQRAKFTPHVKQEYELQDEVEDRIDQDVQDALDRDWYATDEFGHAAGDELHNPFYDQYSYEPEQEERLEEKMRKKLSIRARERKRDADQWEKNRMQKSGIAEQDEIDFEEDEGEQNRVHLFTHNLKPPFLDGEQVFTRQKNPISALRNPESDMAVYSKKGSHVLKERRLKRERERHARQAASMAGTALGNVLGVKEEAEEQDEKVTNNDDSIPEVKQKSQLSIREQREQLPAFAVRDDLLRTIRENQVVIVIGETGSGKTTQLTQFLYEAGFGDRGIIGCTQPRRVAAMSVAKRVSEEMEVRLGDEVGYAIRFEDVTSDKTKIKYLTDGILLREALGEGYLDKYSCIIMDEAHERALNTDILLGLFKQILVRRRDLKLIVTSATMNAERFSQFYGGAPQFTIPGRTFPVDVIHMDHTPPDYVDAAAKQTLQIHVGSGPGDILVFMTGQEDIECVCDLLQERLDSLVKPDPLLILPIYSQMPSDLQAKIFDPAPKGTRKVIVATNVAETSLTVDGISYVVDCGYAKVKVFNPKLNMDALQVMPISQANANQRSGRAGRTSRGTAYRLYTRQAESEEMYPQAIPEIQRSNLSNTILMLKNLGINDLIAFDFIDPPPMNTMTASLYDLWALGALDNIGQLTNEGKRMSAFPTEPSLSKLLVKSAEHQCSEEMVTIVAMLSVSAVFYRPKERADEADSAREKFFVAESDHLTLLNVYKQWLSNRCSEAWCARHFLFGKQLKRAREIREQLVTIFHQQRMKLESCYGDWDVIRKCICSGFFHQAARVKGSDSYSNLRTGVVSKLHPTSALTGLGFLPEFVIYHELVYTSTQYVSNVTAVDPRWLAELGGVFYSIKEKGYIGSSKKAVEIEHSTRMDLEARIERDRVTFEQQKKLEHEKEQRAKKVKKSAVVLPGNKFKFRRRGI